MSIGRVVLIIALSLLATGVFISVIQDERTKEQRKAQPGETKGLVYFRAGTGEVRVWVPITTVYLLETGIDPYQDRPYFNVMVWYKEGNTIQTPLEGFLNVGGNTVKVIVTSDDQELLDIRGLSDVVPAAGGEGGSDPVVLAKAPGQGSIRISIGDHSASIPIRVVQLPVKAGMKMEQVIQVIGLPSKRANEPILASACWEYAKYPGAVLCFCVGKLTGVSSKRVADVDLSQW